MHQSLRDVSEYYIQQNWERSFQHQSKRLKVSAPMKATTRLFSIFLPFNVYFKSQVRRIDKNVEWNAASLLWRVEMSKCIDASPLVVADQYSAYCFIGSHSGKLNCIDFSSGNVVWEILLGNRIESSCCISPCGKFIAVGNQFVKSNDVKAVMIIVSI